MFQVWIDCRGENPLDREMLGPLTYFPRSSGLHQKYFPYTNQPGYHSPLVAVRFTNPVPGVLLHVECRAWAANIKYDHMDRVGKAHFELMVHNSTTAAAVDITGS